MKRKGFTLIELLAVIVILAIIALIATPIIMNVVEDAKKNSAKTSAYAYLDAVDTYISRKILSNNQFKLNCAYKVNNSGNLGNYQILIKGSKPTGGTITYENNKVIEGCLTINNFKIFLKDNEVESVECGQCEAVKEENKSYKTGKKGEVDIIYFNPVTNSSCNATDSNSITGTKDGCMKWYVIKNSEKTDDTVDVILDHNTTAQVTWNDGENKDGAEKTLVKDINNWDASVKENARFITSSEIKDITGKVSETYFNTPEYYWIYEISDCNPCDISDSSTNGYWTDSIKGTYRYGVSRKGFVTTMYMSASKPNGVGIRPVITINKSSLNNSSC